MARDLQNITVDTKYLLKATRKYCLKSIRIYYAEYEPAQPIVHVTLYILSSFSYLYCHVIPQLYRVFYSVSIHI